MARNSRITEIRLGHYKAFENAVIPLSRVTALVGRNGSGKSTIINALGFYRDALLYSLSNALEMAAGFHTIRQRKSGVGPSYDVSIALKGEVNSKEFLYGFRIGSSAKSDDLAIVKEEVLVCEKPNVGFRRTTKTFQTNHKGVKPEIDPSVLALPIMAGVDKLWSRIFYSLRSIQIYSLSPVSIRSEPRIGGRKRLEIDGQNTGDLLKTFQNDPRRMQWLIDRLSAITPGISDVSADSYAGRRIIKFKQRGKSEDEIHEFSAHSMSDGTLRTLALLLALGQRGPSLPLFAIDEIEDSIHPYAMGVLMDTLEMKAKSCPVLITSHSPEILSCRQISGDNLLVVSWEGGISKVHALREETTQQLQEYEDIGDLLVTNALWTKPNPLSIGKKRFFNI